MTVTFRNLLLLVVTSALAACAPSGEQAADNGGANAITVKGALAYRERIALPPGSTARITVSDISIADRKAPVIAEKDIDLGNRQVPIAFELAVAKSHLKQRGRYSLRGTISAPNGQLMWTTDSAHVIDPTNTVNDLGTLWLVRVSKNANSSTPKLTGTEWVVENIAGGGIIDASHATLNFTTDGKLYGNASCNNYSGEYKSTSKGLGVTPLAVTQRACVPALNKQEQKFLQVLQNTRSFDIDKTGKLIIRADSGKTLQAYPGGGVSE